MSTHTALTNTAFFGSVVLWLGSLFYYG